MGRRGASLGARRSFSERIGSLMGQAMPISGSSQSRLCSAFGWYISVHLYWTRAASLTTQKPCAKPGGT